jgi:hypothetical protein
LKKQVESIQRKKKIKEKKQIKKWDSSQIPMHGMMKKILILMKVTMSLDSILPSKHKKIYLKNRLPNLISMIKNK